MFSKELAQKRNGTLRKRKEILLESPELNIYLEFPASLMTKKKNNREQYKQIKRF